MPSRAGLIASLAVPLVGGLQVLGVLGRGGDPPWGRESSGITSRLVPGDAIFTLSQEMPFTLEVRNTGSEALYIDAQQVDVNDAISIRDASGRDLPYIGPWVQTMGERQLLRPGELVILFRDLDIAGQYLLTKPGRYTVRFRGTNAAFGEVPLPPSDKVSIRVTRGQLRLSREVASRLIEIVTRAGWRLRIVTDGEVTPTGRSSTNGVLLELSRPATLKSDALSIRLWAATRPANPLETRPQGPATVAQHLGRSPRGDIYFEADRGVADVWPSIRRELKNALEISDSQIVEEGPDRLPDGAIDPRRKTP